MATANEYVSLNAEARKWPTVLVFGGNLYDTNLFMVEMSGDEDYCADFKGAFGLAGTLVTPTTGTSESSLVLLEAPSLMQFGGLNGHLQFRDIAQRLYEGRVNLTAVVYCHATAMRKNSYEQVVLKCLDVFDKILDPHIYHRLFAVEILEPFEDLANTQEGAAGDSWAQRVAKWQTQGATYHRIKQLNPENKAILPSFISETGVLLELQTKLVQQPHLVNSLTANFIQDVKPSAQSGRANLSGSDISVGSSPGPEGSNANAASENPLPAQSYTFRSSVTPVPMSLNEAYRRLRENQIRLIRLLGGPRTDAISINIFQVELKDSPDYEALSYVVGPLPPTAQLNVRLENGDIATLPVTSHLENILKTLRQPNKDRLLWVDALSIAQQDAEEKATQIQNMGRIFETAKNVCVWLGSETRESNAAMEFIPRVLDFHNMDATFAKTTEAQQGWISLAKLITVPYFERRFIVQEVAFAKRATVYCGSKMVNWFDLADAAVLLEKHWPTLMSQLSHQERYHLGDIHAPGAMSLVQLTSRSLHKDNAGRVTARLVGIESLLTTLAMFVTTLPHDAIYSIISLARDTYQGKSLRVDYTIPPAELFAEVVVSIIKATGSLDIMCRPWAPFAGFDLPSWVSKSKKYPFFMGSNGQYDRRHADGLVGLPERRIYNSSGDTSCLPGFQYSTSRPRQSVKSRGVVIGAVSTAYEKSQHGSIPDEWLRFRWPAYDMSVTARKVQNQSSTSVAATNARQTLFREILWRTLFADRTKDGQVAPRWYVRACHHCLSNPGEHWGEQAVNLDKLIQRSPEKLGEVLSRIRDTIWGRKLFQYRHILPETRINKTDQFYSLGLGPGELREGDIVAVLFGCSVPLILREFPSPQGSSLDALQTNDFELIGEAYTFGRMDGEALEKKDDGTYILTEKVFEIF